MYDQFTSVEPMQIAMSAVGVGYYAAASAPDGSVTIFYVTSGWGEKGRQELEPLEQFGFEVKPGPITAGGEASSPNSTTMTRQAPTASTPTASLTPTENIIRTAKVGDCVALIAGKTPNADGGFPVTVNRAACGSVASTYRVDRVLDTDDVSLCNQYPKYLRNRTAGLPPVTLCLVTD